MASRSLRVVRWSPVALLVALAACDPVEGADAGESSPPPDLCEVSTQVFEPDCVRCHAADSAPPDLTFEGASVGLVNMESGSYPGRLLVVPGDPPGSLLFRKMSGTQAADEGDVMPVGATLSAAQLKVVEGWIEGGAGTTCTP